MKKAARLEHAANAPFAGAPARVVLPLAGMVRILGEASCYPDANYMRLSHLRRIFAGEVRS